MNIVPKIKVIRQVICIETYFATANTQKHMHIDRNVDTIRRTSLNFNLFPVTPFPAHTHIPKPPLAQWAENELVGFCPKQTIYSFYMTVSFLHFSLCFGVIHSANIENLIPDTIASILLCLFCENFQSEQEMIR